MSLTSVITVRVTSDERDALNAVAELLGVTLSTFVRDSAIGAVADAVAGMSADELKQRYRARQDERADAALRAIAIITRKGEP